MTTTPQADLEPRRHDQPAVVDPAVLVDAARYATHGYRTAAAFVGGLKHLPVRWSLHPSTTTSPA